MILQRLFQGGRSFPGFMMPIGSNRSLMRRIMAMAPGGLEHLRALPPAAFSPAGCMATPETLAKLYTPGGGK